MAYIQEKSPFPCWKDYVQRGTKMKGGREVPNCVPKKSPVTKKTKGGGTRKVCLPASKVKSMSAAEKKKVIAAKESAASKGKQKRSSKSNVKGARRPGATLKDWFEKENWINVKTGGPCGE